MVLREEEVMMVLAVWDFCWFLIWALLAALAARVSRFLVTFLEARGEPDSTSISMLYVRIRES